MSAVLKGEPEATASTGWQVICRVDEIPMLGARRVHREGAPAVAVFRTDGDRVFALLDRCPHKGGPLSQGIVHGSAVTCPLHNWVIDLQTGAAQGADEGCARPLAVRVDGGRVRLAQAVAAERAA